MYEMGGNTCKQCDQQGVNIQNTQKAHTTQNWKKKKSKCLNQQMGRRPKQMLFHKHRQPTGTWKDA